MMEAREYAGDCPVSISIPLLGCVAAGQPLEVFTVEETLDLPRSIWNGRRVFALRVRGQSMVEAGIHDGDYLIVEPTENADNGRTVVAEVDGRVTVKKLYREPRGRIRLQPANPAVLPFVVNARRVRVRGVVVGVLRKYGFRKRRGTAQTSRPAVSLAKRADTASRSATPPLPLPAVDESRPDIAVNAIDTRLEQWQTIQNKARCGERGVPRDQLAIMGRELRALRDWCARTTKPRLRQALLKEATKLMQEMDRVLAWREGELPQASA